LKKANGEIQEGNYSNNEFVGGNIRPEMDV